MRTPPGIAVTVNHQHEEVITHRTIGLNGIKYFFMGLTSLWFISSIVALTLSEPTQISRMNPVITTRINPTYLLQAALGLIAMMYFLWAFFKRTQVVLSPNNLTIIRRFGPFKTTSTFNKTTFAAIELVQSVGRSEKDGIRAFSAVGVLPNKVKVTLFAWQSRDVAQWLSTRLNNWRISDSQSAFSGYVAIPKEVEISNSTDTNAAASNPTYPHDLNSAVKNAVETRLYGISENQSKSTTFVGGVIEIFFHKVIKKLAIGLVILALVIAYIELVEPRLAKKPVTNQKPTTEKTNTNSDKK